MSYEEEDTCHKACKYPYIMYERVRAFACACCMRSAVSTT
jgi:hypothetical protein